jgi:hypothetical protein
VFSVVDRCLNVATTFYNIHAKRYANNNLGIGGEILEIRHLQKNRSSDFPDIFLRNPSQTNR